MVDHARSVEHPAHRALVRPQMVFKKWGANMLCPRKLPRLHLIGQDGNQPENRKQRNMKRSASRSPMVIDKDGCMEGTRKNAGCKGILDHVEGKVRKPRDAVMQ